MERYNQILVLKKKLECEGIPFDFEEMFGGYHILYPNKEDVVCSVIEHDGSYGNDADLLEIMGLTADEDVEGYLTAEDVFNRIAKHYNSLQDIGHKKCGKPAEKAVPSYCGKMPDGVDCAVCKWSVNNKSESRTV